MGSTERAIFVAKSVSKSKLSHYLAALATFIVGGRRELWRSSLTGQLHSMVAVSGAAGRPANPLSSSYRFLSQLLRHEGGRGRGDDRCAEYVLTSPTNNCMPTRTR